MVCTTQTELPAPPVGRVGWPWSEFPEPIPESRPDGSPWPRITVVTVSYNQGRFLEETIRSILLQGYPNLEYIVMDGGSSDDSVEIIERYAPWIAYWQSAPDRGQSHALNMGFARATGDIIAWLNSDDTYAANSLQQAATHLDPSRPQLFVGGAGLVDIESRQLSGTKQRQHMSLSNLIYDWQALPQPACFWTQQAISRTGPLDERLNYTMDRELFLRMFLQGVERRFFPSPIVAFERKHADQKTQSPERVYQEFATVLRQHFGSGMSRLWFEIGLRVYPRWQAMRRGKLRKALRGGCRAHEFWSVT